MEIHKINLAIVDYISGKLFVCHHKSLLEYYFFLVPASANLINGLLCHQKLGHFWSNLKDFLCALTKVFW